MKSILLAVYGVRVKRIHTRKDYERLDSFSDEGADLMAVLKEILDSYTINAFRKEDSQQVLQTSNVTNTHRHIEGLVEIGQYGSESDIRNLDRWGQVAYRKASRDVDLQPFYFLFDIPEGKDLGLLLVQRTGIEGVQAVLGEALHESFVEDYPDHRLTMSQLVPEKLLEELQNEDNQLAEVRFIRHRVPTDITTVIGRKGTEQTHGTIEVVVRPKEAGTIRALRQYMDKNRGTDNILEFEETRFHYDNIKIKFKFHGKERTMDLDDPKRIRATFDITEQVKLSPGGHPNFKSISQVARGILDDLKDELYGSANGA